MRVLWWILQRIEGKLLTQNSKIGIHPIFDKFCWKGLDFSPSNFEKIISVHPAEWKKEIESHQQIIEKIGEKFPLELLEIFKELELKFK